MKKNKSGYSVILAILMVGFMVVLSGGVYMLVLQENKDSKAMEYYLKSYMGAEGTLELALLKLKDYNYSFSEEITHDINNFSVLLSHEPLDKSKFKKQKETFISYKIDSLTNSIDNKTLLSGKFEIIPLFYFDNNKNEIKVKDLELSGVGDDVIWNILGNNGGISGNGSFTKETLGNYRTLEGQNISFQNKKVGDFLSDSSNNYLILHNVGTDTNYNLKSNDNKFLKDVIDIIASGETFGYKQNLKTSINLGEYLNLLKYSVFSPN